MYLPTKDKYISVFPIQFLTILNVMILGIVRFENIWMLYSILCTYLWDFILYPSPIHCNSFLEINSNLLYNASMYIKPIYIKTLCAGLYILAVILVFQDPKDVDTKKFLSKIATTLALIAAGIYIYFGAYFGGDE